MLLLSCSNVLQSQVLLLLPYQDGVLFVCCTRLRPNRPAAACSKRRLAFTMHGCIEPAQLQLSYCTLKVAL